MQKSTIRFIGAGIGAMTAAILLKRSGFNVIIYDKGSEERAGGIVASVKEHGCRFSRGPSIVAMHKFYEAGFEKLGLDFLNSFQFIDIDPIAKFFFYDGRTLTITRDVEETAAEFEKIAEGSGKQFKRFYKHGTETYRHLETLLDPRIPLWRRLVWDPTAWPRRLGLFKTAWQYAHRYFTHPDLIAAIARYSFFSGDTPLKASYASALIPVIEMTEGPKHIIGGLGEIARTLKNLAEREGVTFEWNTEIDEIDVQGKQAVRLKAKDGREAETRGELVVVNAGLPYAYSHLLRNTRYRKTYKEHHFTNSFCLLNLAIEDALPGLGFDAHFVPKDFRGFVEIVQGERGVTQEAIFWAVNYSAVDKTAAPDGMSALTISFDGPHLTHENESVMADFAEIALRKVLERFKFHDMDIERSIKYHSAFSIEQWREEFNKPHGAPFGIFQHRDPLGSISQPHTTKVKNVLHVGNPRSIPLTLLDGLSLAELIENSLDIS